MHGYVKISPSVKAEQLSFQAAREEYNFHFFPTWLLSPSHFQPCVTLKVQSGPVK
jgi:hypothetical protein